MPYIKQQTRTIHAIGLLAAPRPLTPGDLNFVLSSLVLQYIADCGLSYVTLNEALGVLEAVKLELYRRVVGPYEDRKIAENGDLDGFHMLRAKISDA